MLCQHYLSQYYFYQSYLGQISLPAQVRFFDLPKSRTSPLEPVGADSIRPQANLPIKRKRTVTEVTVQSDHILENPIKPETRSVCFISRRVVFSNECHHAK